MRPFKWNFMRNFYWGIPLHLEVFEHSPPCDLIPTILDHHLSDLNAFQSFRVSSLLQEIFGGLSFSFRLLKVSKRKTFQSNPSKGP